MRKSVLLALSLLGLFDSSYLLWVYTSPSRPLVCFGGGCDVVRASSYAHLWGLPLPVYGVAMYAALTLFIFAEALMTARWAAMIPPAVLAISVAGCLVSTALTGIEGLVIHAWCAWCMVSALTVTAIMVLALLEHLRPASPPDPGTTLANVRRHFVVLAVAVVVGVPAFYFLSRHGELPAIQAAPLEALTERLVRPDSHATGNLQSTVTVVEFGDFQCPVCGQAEKTMRKIRAKYGGRVRFVFRQFPLVNLHEYAQAAAVASECAAEQGKFWEAFEKLYDDPNDLTDAALGRYAADLGLDRNRFSQCLSSSSVAGRIRKDVADGDALGVRATPTFFVNRHAFQGMPSFDEFARLIEQELNAHVQLAPSPGIQHQPEPKPNRNGSAPSAPSEAAKTAPEDAGFGAFGNAGSGIFSQAGSNPLACSPDELKQQQPAVIRTAEAEQLFNAAPKALFVDVRESKDFASEHIPGAINVPIEEIGQKWISLPKDKTIVFYEGGKAGGSTGDVCAFSRAAGRVLLAHGFGHDQVKVFQDGVAGWEKAGMPVAR